MINHYDIAYAFGVGLSAPFWLVKPTARRKVFAALSDRMGHAGARDVGIPAVMVHAVSLGEINATRELISRLRQQRPGLQFIVSTTTETGFKRGRELYGTQGDVSVVRYPLDFSHAVNRLLDTLRPSVVALMELEVWPNFLRKCRQRGVPVVLINGRITPHSFSRYRLVKPVTAAMFRRLARVCAQDQAYADRFIALGAPADRVAVTGTMKFDTAVIEESAPGADELAAAVGLSPEAERIWVCGSTGPGEEEIILDQYRLLLQSGVLNLRLVIVPRHPQRFDEVADLIRAAKFRCLRRSRNTHPPPGAIPLVVLGDTMGELRQFYSLADVVFVGRTLVDLGPRQHGSDMIEPAALRKPVIVGPYTGNFAEPMAHFLAAEAIRVVDGADALREEVYALLIESERSGWMAKRAQDVVRNGRGATDLHVAVILDQLTAPPPGPQVV